MEEERISKNENYSIGIGEAKILCMFFIVLLHTLGHGGVIAGTELLSINYEIMWLMKCFCLCAVNCYAIISGYLLVNKSFKLSRIFKLWIEVEFFSIFVVIISMLIPGNTVSGRQLVLSFFPFLSKQYWYFTIYVGVFFLTPYLNLMVRKFSKKSIEKMLITIFALVCIIPTIINFDLFETPTGSLFWMCYCYLIGGYIKQYGVRINRPLFLYGLGAIVMWGGRFAYEVMKKRNDLEYGGGAFLILDTYVSPFCLLSALGLFFLFENKIVKNNAFAKIISNIAQMSFAVYLVHDNGTFKKNIWNNLFISLGDLNIILLVGSVILIAIVVYIICISIEYVRMRCCKSIEKLVTKVDRFNWIFEIESEK